MTPSPHRSLPNRLLIGTGLGIALIIAVLLSPFASQHPDGLDRVAQDLEFEHWASEEPAAQKLPFYRLFDEYALRGVPEAVATPLAGLLGTLAAFGLAWGIGKLVTRPASVTGEGSGGVAPPEDLEQD
ncbi:PDGLE domain-containing protein [Trichothermofontia sp.]